MTVRHSTVSTGILNMEHTTTGETVMLTIEDPVNDPPLFGHVKRVSVTAGTQLDIDRTGAVCTLKWRKQTPTWHDFPDSLGVFAVDAAVPATIEISDPN